MRITGRILRSHVDMVHGKPLTVIFSFALPLLVGNLFNQLYNVVDTAIVGRALGADALAAVGSTGNINACLFLLLGGLATGVSVIVSQYWGAKKYDELRRLLGTFTTLLLAGSAVLAALGAALAEPLLRLLQLPAELLPTGVTYLRITAGLLLGNALYNAAGAVLPAVGIRYARTVADTGKYNFPQDWLRWDPTCHIFNHLLEYGQRFVERTSLRKPLLFYVWGHSWELNGNDGWTMMEQFCKQVGGRDDIWYATNIAVYDYMQAVSQLEFTADADRVYNRSAADCWLYVNGATVRLPAGEITAL